MFGLANVISTVIWPICALFDYFFSLTTITLCYFLYKLSNIFNITPNCPHRINNCQFGSSPCSHHAQGCIGCKLLIQATHNHHPAMLLPPWQTLNVFAASKDHKSSTLHPFDSDSFQIKINNCASKCITNCIEDFMIPPDPISLNIIGVGGNIPCTHIGTVNWVIEDDQGHKHLFNIPGTIYAPLAPHRLLSPQHWSQAANDNIPNPNGTWCGTYADHVQLHWSQCHYTRTVPLDVSTNTATLYTAAGFTAATALCKDLINFTPAAYAHLIPSEERGFPDLHEAEEVGSTALEPDLEMPTSSSPLLPQETYHDPEAITPSEWLRM